MNFDSLTSAVSNALNLLLFGGLPMVSFFGNLIFGICLMFWRSPLALLERLALATGHISLAVFQFRLFVGLLSYGRGGSPSQAEVLSGVAPPVLLILAFFALLYLAIRQNLRRRTKLEGFPRASYLCLGLFAVVMAISLLIVS